MKTNLAFLDDEGKVLFITDTFSKGVRDIIAQSTLTPVLTDENTKVGDVLTINKIYQNYEVGDICFIYHMQANYVVFELRDGKKEGFKIPSFEEINPKNPKMAHRIYPMSGCDYPKVK